MRITLKYPSLGKTAKALHFVLQRLTLLKVRCVHAQTDFSILSGIREGLDYIQHICCHAAHQTRSEDSGLKTAYHSFQASAGMFTYINENFLHAPSTDLSRDTVKTLIQIMLAQGQEVFLEKQIADGKKVGLLAKLASQAGYLYSQAVEGTQENVNKAIFEKVWLLVVQVRLNNLLRSVLCASLKLYILFLESLKSDNN